MPARLFFRIKNNKKNISRAPKTLLVALVFFLVIFVHPTTSFADIPQPRHIADYKTLWLGGENPDDGQVREGLASGIIYLGPQTADNKGFDTDGLLKKVRAIVSLNIDTTKYRAWDMIGGRFDGPQPIVENKRYLRLFEQSFVVRTYQKDSSGQPINVSLSFVPVDDFLDDTSHTPSHNRLNLQLAKDGKALPQIVKYRSGTGTWENQGLPFFGTSKREDGYIYGPDGGGSGMLPMLLGGGLGGIKGAILGKTIGYMDSAGPVLITAQTAVVDLNLSEKLEKGKPAYMDFWYVGSDRLTITNSGSGLDNGFRPAGEGAGEIPPHTTDPYDRVQYFDNIPIGAESNQAWIHLNNYKIYPGKMYPYFQIGKTIEFTPPRDAADATLQATGAETASQEVGGNLQTNQGALPVCNILKGIGGGDGSFLGCVALVVHYAIYQPIQWFAGMMGKLFDFFLGYSLDDASYRAEFVVTAWRVVRDISNIFFIVILIWTGLSTALGIGKISMKQVVPNLIINALIINFSLFATRLVVDVSNIVARVFYNVINVQRVVDGVPVNANNLGTAGYKPLSEKIVSKFNPQKLFSPKLISTASYNAKEDSSATTRAVDTGSPDYAAYYIMVSLLASLILFATAMLFWKTAFFFLGRVIGIYVVMIFSPFAFLTQGNMPIFGNIQRLRWSDWLKELTQYALLAPIFVFFLYIVYLLSNSDFIIVGILDPDKSFLNAILATSIPLLVIYFLIKYGVNIAKTYSGYVGGMVQQAIAKNTGRIIGGGIGVAAGGAAFVGRNTIGRGVRAIAKNTTAGRRWSNWAATNADTSKWARFNNNVLNRTQTGSWDIRNAGIKAGSKEYSVGSTINKGFGFLGEKLKDEVSGTVGLGQNKALGKDGKAGGVTKLAEEREKRRADAIKNKINYNHLSDDEAKAVWEKKKNDARAKHASANWESHATSDETLGDLSRKLESAKAHEADMERHLADARTRGDKLAIADAEGFHNEAKVAREKVENDFNEAKVNSVTELKKDPSKIKNSSAYKTAELAAEDTDELKRLNLYNVKNKAGLEAAMRAEYAKNMRDSSFWMKDGKGRVLPASIQAMLGGIAAFMPGIGAVIGAAMLANITDGLIKNNSLGHVTDRATNRIIKEATKNIGRANTEQQLDERITELKNKVIETVNKHFGKFYKKFEDIEYKHAEEAILEKTSALEAKIDSLNDEIRGHKARGESAAAEAKVKERVKYEHEQREHQDILDRIERMQERADRMKDTKERKDKDKKSEGDKKKPEEDKDKK